MQGSGIALIDMAAATVTMNDDGSFNLLTGSTDLGTGSDTVLAQIAAEVLGIGIDAVLVIAADTDLTPFDKGAYASSTTYVSGKAVEAAALAVRAQILAVAAGMLEARPEDLKIVGGHIEGPRGSVSLADIGRRSYYGPDPGQIAATASFVPEASPPPFMAAFAGVEVDVETGLIRVTDFLAAVDCGTAVNPLMTEGQVEGAVANGIGYALTEEMQFTARGRTRQPRPRPLQDPRRRRPPADHRDARGLLRADRADGGEVGCRDRDQRPTSRHRQCRASRRRHPPHPAAVYSRKGVARVAEEVFSRQSSARKPLNCLETGDSSQSRIRSMNSDRVSGFVRNPPRIAEVTIDEPCFWTPRIIMQK